jgi:cob(I)alamin adenosyltransferase
MKIYTGTGDSGKTSLFSGERIGKSNNRIEAYGAVDELNAMIGVVIALIPVGTDAELAKAQLTRIQSDLFRLGACLATTADSPSKALLEPVDENDSQRLEEQMDQMQLKLPELTAFILPGGHPSAAWSHVARTVCRRAERRIVALLEQDVSADVDAGSLLTYVNRLSDYLFVLARYCNYLAGVNEEVWGR